MAEEKMTIVDLRKAIAKQTGSTEAIANIFLSSLIEVVTEGLKRDKSVKIGGLGTFKLQWVEPRKSVNISTGEDIIIDGYNKLGFSPETSVKNRINEPFSTLEAVELDEDGNPIPGADKPKNTVIDKFGEQALEIKELLEDIQEPEGNPIEATAEPIVESTEPAEESKEPIVEATEPVEETTEPVVAPAEPIVEATEPVVEITEPAEENIHENKEPEVQKKPFRGWLVALITMLVLFLLLVVGYFGLRYALVNLFEGFSGKQTTAIEQTAEPAPEEPMVASETPDDTATFASPEEEPQAEPSETTTESKEVAAPEHTSLNQFLQSERQYTEFQDVVTVNEGSRLTWISKKQYGRKDFWVFIYEANRDIIKDPGNVQIGTKLRIPKLPDEVMHPGDPEQLEAYTKMLHDKYVQ